MPSTAWQKLTQQKHFLGLKNATVAFMVLLLLFSIILIGVGSGGIQTLSTYDSLLKVTIPAGVIVLGLFLLISTILGLIGIYKQNAKVFSAYLFILFLLIICQFGVGGGGYTYRDTIPTKLEDNWKYLSDKDKNAIQQYFLCCGWGNNTDSPGSNCLGPNITDSTTGFLTTASYTTGAVTTGQATSGVVTSGVATTSFPTTSAATTSDPTTSVPTTGVPTTAQATTGVPTTAQATTAQGTTAQATTGEPTTAQPTTDVPLQPTTGQPTSATLTTAGATASESTAQRKRQDDMTTEYVYTTGAPLPDSTDQPCGDLLVTSVQAALYYVSAVEVAFAVIQLVGLICGLAMAIWLLAQAGKQRFNKLDEEEMGEKFTREEFKGDKSDEDDDGMSDPPQGEPGKRKIVVNFGN